LQQVIKQNAYHVVYWLISLYHTLLLCQNRLTFDHGDGGDDDDDNDEFISLMVLYINGNKSTE